jgi:1-acyl-sn-glycerol-3-phosphate acyltransferase
VGIFPEGGITRDGEIQPFRPGIEKILARRPVPVVPMALCFLWGSLFSRRDPLHKRRPTKLWKPVELRIGEPIPPDQATADRVEAEVRALRGEDR